MPRTVPEWIGKTDDARPPPRVRLRVFLREDGKCMECGRKIMPGETWICDHRKALINGGQNREKNLGPICEWCDDNVKTPADNAEKSAVATKAKKHIGIKKRSSFANSKNGRWKTRLTSNGPRTELRR